ncbi:MAG: hypothetical protein ABWY05_05590 [Noviherbaspirillum sp.]
MAGASALFSDGLDLLAEFLACSRPAADGIAASYEQPEPWRAAAAELARWSQADAADAGCLVLDEATLRIIAPEPLWNRLYARALLLGRTVAPDRIGLRTRGAGGMLAALSGIPALAQALRPVAAPGLADANGEPWLLLPWPQLRALMLRDRLLAPEALLARPLLEVLPARAVRFDGSLARHGSCCSRTASLCNCFARAPATSASPVNWAAISPKACYCCSG